MVAMRGWNSSPEIMGRMCLCNLCHTILHFSESSSPSDKKILESHITESVSSKIWRSRRVYMQQSLTAATMSLFPSSVAHGYLHSFPVILCVWNISSTSHASAGSARMRSDPCEWQMMLKLEAVGMSDCQGCDVPVFRS